MQTTPRLAMTSPPNGSNGPCCRLPEEEGGVQTMIARCYGLEVHKKQVTAGLALPEPLGAGQSVAGDEAGELVDDHPDHPVLVGEFALLAERWVLVSLPRVQERLGEGEERTAQLAVELVAV
jgi:hypothetical protein